MVIASITAGLLLLMSNLDLKAQAEFPKTITVKGSVQFVTPRDTNKIWLYKEVVGGDHIAIDSVEVTKEDKTFQFTIHQDHPGIYQVSAMHWDRASFWSDADVTMHLRGYDTARVHIKIPHYNFVEGSMDNNFINLYEQISQLGYLRMVDEYNERYYAKKHAEEDSAWIKYLTTTKFYDSLRVDRQKRMDVLMKMYKDRPVLLYALRTRISPNNADEYNHTLTLLDRLIQKYPWLTEAKEAKQVIITNQKLAKLIKPGMPLPSINYPDMDGVLHGLGKYKGKYLLIDFWASWCGPCRAAIPKVKELYASYHPKKLNIVSISIDDSKKDWKKAVNEEEMPWQQLLSPDNERTMKKFQFSGIPTMYLIDPEGKIIKSYTGYSPEAEKSIKSIIKQGITAPEGKSIPAATF